MRGSDMKWYRTRLLLVGFLLTSVLLMQCKTTQTTVVTPEPVIPEMVDYDNTVAGIMYNYCTTCHTGDQPAARLNLETYESVVTAVERHGLVGRIHSTVAPMPPSGLMPKKERLLIKRWKNLGFPKDGAALDTTSQSFDFTRPVIKPVDLEFEGFEFMELIQGHWIGRMNIMGEKYSWFAFDYRPISATHIHGIYEAGTMGNLFTTFFIADYKGTRTIMARNGGVLNGIYRTSYFVLEKVEVSGKDRHYEFVDAFGDRDIMWMELTFSGDELQFNSYTSRFGAAGAPSQHMKFTAYRKHPELSAQAGGEFGFPKNEAGKDFSTGLPEPDWGANQPLITSASYTVKKAGLSVEELAKLSGDPYTITDMPNLARLSVSIALSEESKPYNTLLYLSIKPLTNGDGQILMAHGYPEEDATNTILSFPELVAGQSDFTFTYLHPGTYYLTVITDVDSDGFLSSGDISSKSREVVVRPQSHETIRVEDLMYLND